MKKHVVLLCSTAAMAGISLSASAGMTGLADSRLSEISAQGYVVSVGANNYALPFAYEVAASQAPGWVIGPQKNFVAAITPGYPAEVDAARADALVKVNGKLSVTTSYFSNVARCGRLGTAGIHFYTLNSAPHIDRCGITAPLQSPGNFLFRAIFFIQSLRVLFCII